MTALDILKAKYITLNTEIKLLEQLRNTMRDVETKVLLLKAKKKRLLIKDKIAVIEKDVEWS